jgi:hypothetical protein
MRILRKFYVLSILMVSASIIISGCSSAPVAPTASKGEPDWVNKGSGAFDTPKGKVFYGVGVAQGIKNIALLRSTADDRARVEIVKTIKIHIARLKKDYQASTTGGADMSLSTEEQHTWEAIESYAEMELNGAEIIDRWRDTSEGVQYALAKLDLTAFKDTLDKAKELNSKVRDFVKDNANKAFEELNKEKEKRGNK